MLTATMLVLLMTIPGLALFYGSMVRAKNLLSVLMQCFAITALISVLWMLYGYSVAFSTAGMQAGTTNLHSFMGRLDRALFAGMTPHSLYQRVPESVFAMFQLTFAIITPALIVGAVAERMKFSALLVFTAAWFTVVYLPMAAGTIGPGGALIFGVIAGVTGFFAATRLKHRFGYDDSLDVFGVHAIAGIVGALLTGPFAAPVFGGFGGFGDVAHPFGQLWIQAKGVVFTIVWSAGLTWLILVLIKLTLGLRVDDEQEQIGLDLALHEERGYNLS